MAGTTTKRGATVEVNAQEARDNLADLAYRTHYTGARFRVLRNGRPAFAVVSVADLERLESLERPAKR